MFPPAHITQTPLNFKCEERPAALSKKEQKDLMQKSGEIIAEILEDDLHTTDTETTIELNFAVLKFKHVIKRKNQ